MPSSTPSSSSGDSSTYLPNHHRVGEDLEKYEVGGLHPVIVGETYKQQAYRIVHKLGSGGYSTVWVAQANGRLYSLKFVSARTSARNQEAARALEIQKVLGTDSAALVDVFEHRGPNCGTGTRHKVLVSELLGPSIARLSYGRTRLLPVVAKKVMHRTAAAVGKLHAANLVHRDLTPKNVLLRLRSHVQTSALPDFYRTYGQPLSNPVRRCDGRDLGTHAPAVCYEAIDFATMPDNVSHNPVLIDFGETDFVQNAPKKRLGIPAAYAAPEVLLENTVSPASDVWSLGCMIFQARSGDQLFSYDTPADVFFSMLCTLTPTIGPPKPAWQRVKFDEYGFANIRSLPDSEPGVYDHVEIISNLDPQLLTPLRDRIYQIADKPTSIVPNSLYWGSGELLWDSNVGSYPRISPGEASLLHDLLSKIFVWDPRQRITASEVMAHPWFSS